MTEPWYAYVIMAIAFTGTAFNVRKHRACWLLWAVSNSGALAYFLAAGLYTQAGVALVNGLMCLWGWRAWSMSGRQTPARTPPKVRGGYQPPADSEGEAGTPPSGGSNAQDY